MSQWLKIHRKEKKTLAVKRRENLSQVEPNDVHAQRREASLTPREHAARLGALITGDRKELSLYNRRNCFWW